MTNTNNYAVDDEFGTEIASGLTRDEAKKVAQHYLEKNRGAAGARIYQDSPDGEGECWDVALPENWDYI